MKNIYYRMMKEKLWRNKNKKAQVQWKLRDKKTKQHIEETILLKNTKNSSLCLEDLKGLLIQK